MATPIVTDPNVNFNDRLAQPISSQQPNILIRSFDLISMSYMPTLNNAICIVRDRETGAVKQKFASNLVAFSYGKDAYLLELLSDMGGNDYV